MRPLRSRQTPGARSRQIERPLPVPAERAFAPFRAWSTYPDYKWLVVDMRTMRCVAGPFDQGEQATMEALRRNTGAAR